MSDFEQDRALDVLLEDAVTEAEEEAPRRRPSFANVVARAHAIDREAVPAESVRRAVARSQVDAVVEHRPSFANDVEVFIAAAREEAQADIAKREALGVPPWRATTGKPRRFGVVVAACAAVAAALVLTLGPGGLRRDASRVDPAALQAQASELGESTSSEAIEGPPKPKRSVRTPKRDRSPAPAESTHAESASEPTPETPQEPDPPRAAPKQPRRPPLRERLEALDARAEQALARGDVGEADALYRRIISEGGRHPRAELAYGERFTIAHRQRQPSKQRKLYRAYLRAFPRGRFVDDALAGLCRTAAQAERAECWVNYLDDRPEGAYASEAKRWSEHTP